MTIKMNQGLYTVGDIYGRQITISTNEGLLIRDAAGRIVHDTPTAPLQVDRFYCGHLLFMEGASTSYQIYVNINAPKQTWTDVVCLTDKNKIIRAGLFKVFALLSQTGAQNIKLDVSLRPKGTSWLPNTANATPSLRLSLSNTSSQTNLEICGSLICPIGTDNNIQFYLDYSGDASGLETLVITQLGIFI